MRQPSGRAASRGILASVLVAAVFGMGVAPVAAVADDGWATSPDDAVDYAHSAALAYEFLDARVDEYCSDDGMCLPRSYQGGYFTTPDWDYTPSFVYDDALVVIAYAARGLPDDVRRARAIGDALLFLQANDPVYDDGRTRASYEPAALREGRVEVAGSGSFTGNQAWVGMALARLYDMTGEQKYLDGAVRVGEWIEDNAADTSRAPFGYTGGQDAEGRIYSFKSTEHNIDVTGFFTQLAQLTGDTVWSDRAAIAARFVAAMQHPDGHLSTGTHLDGTTVNLDPIPEDPQTWSLLASRDSRYDDALTWTLANLQATDGPYRGPAFSDADLSKVWFEGSGHLALALRLRGAPGDAAEIDSLLSSVELAQRTAPNGDGRGIVAASTDGLDSGFGDKYYASLHTGATAWYLLAVTGANPFRLRADVAAPTPSPTPSEGDAFGAGGATTAAGDDDATAQDVLAESGLIMPRVAAAGALLVALSGAVLVLRRRRRS